MRAGHPNTDILEQPRSALAQVQKLSHGWVNPIGRTDYRRSPEKPVGSTDGPSSD